MYTILTYKQCSLEGIRVIIGTHPTAAMLCVKHTFQTIGHYGRLYPDAC
uniref:Uncharacterized protein n=1 Tax=Arundo donax TaxID=35708 RepID=A0A0A9C8B1_ARUDO